MMASPAYESAVSPSAHSLDAYPSDWQPATFLPTYCDTFCTRWWEKAAEEVYQTSEDFDDIILVDRYVPLPDPTIGAALLSRRSEGWLDSFLNDLCRNGAVEKPQCNSLLSMAEAIVSIIRRRPQSPASGWNGNWVISALISSTSTTIPAIAEKLDTEMHSAFCTKSFRDWEEWRLGYPNEHVASFLGLVYKLRNDLVQFVEQDSRILANLQLLQNALPTKQPLLLWIVSTAISSDTSSHPSDSLRGFLDPIEQRFREQRSSVSRLSQELSILDTRFKLKIVHASDVNWSCPFPTDFTLWESIHRNTPGDLADANTESVGRIYAAISIEDILQDGRYLIDVGRLWSDLSDDILACVSTKRKLTHYFIDLAESLLVLRNVHSATAIGLALSKSGFQPCGPSRVWDIINPKDNFAGCREFMDEEPCLPLIFPYILALRLSGNAPNQVLRVLQFAAWYGRRRDSELEQREKAGRQGTKNWIWVTYEIEQKYEPISLPHRFFKTTISTGTFSISARCAPTQNSSSYMPASQETNLQPFTVELQQLRNALNKIVEEFEVLAYFGREEEETEHHVGKEVLAAERNSSNHLPSSSLIMRPKRKALQDLYLEGPQYNSPNAKRRRVNDSPYTPELPLLLKGTEGGDKEILFTHAVAQSLKNVELPGQTTIDFRKKNANEIRAQVVEKNSRIFKEACQQMERMLLLVPDAPAVALEILSALERTEIVLISCATIVAGQCFLDVISGVDPESWRDEERAAFTRKFTTGVVGSWAEKEILNKWKKLAKVLINEVYLRRSGKVPDIKGYPSAQAEVKIWRKLVPSE